LVKLHDLRDDGLKDGFIRHVVDTVAKWEVDGIVFSLANTNISQFASTREVLSILVEGHSHDSVRGIKGLFDTVTVVNINVDVQHTLIESEKLENTKDNV